MQHPLPWHTNLVQSPFRTEDGDVAIEASSAAPGHDGSLTRRVGGTRCVLLQETSLGVLDQGLATPQDG